MDSGSVIVAAPVEATDSKLEAVVHRIAPWILRQSPDGHMAPPRKRFVSGETLPYLGRNVRLIVLPTHVPSPEVRFDHWSFRVAMPIALDESKRYDGAKKAVVRWYRRRAEQRLPRMVELWRKRMRRKLRTKRGQESYGLRKETVELVFGQIKQGELPAVPAAGLAESQTGMAADLLRPQPAEAVPPRGLRFR